MQLGSEEKSRLLLEFVKEFEKCSVIFEKLVDPKGDFLVNINVDSGKVKLYFYDFEYTELKYLESITHGKTNYEQYDNYIRITYKILNNLYFTFLRRLMNRYGPDFTFYVFNCY